MERLEYSSAYLTGNGSVSGCWPFHHETRQSSCTEERVKVRARVRIIVKCEVEGAAQKDMVDVVWCGVVWCGVVWCGVVW